MRTHRIDGNQALVEAPSPGEAGGGSPRLACKKQRAAAVHHGLKAGVGALAQVGAVVFVGRERVQPVVDGGVPSRGGLGQARVMVQDRGH